MGNANGHGHGILLAGGVRRSGSGRGANRAATEAAVSAGPYKNKKEDAAVLRVKAGALLAIATGAG